MRKKVGIIKRLFCLLLIFLLGINSFAAIVSDNDGSAFITKAEFDALKSSFQAQIDTYNQSIDSKIDGAIASYLAGIKLSTEVELTNVYNNNGGSSIKWVNLASFPSRNASWDTYGYGLVAVAAWTSHGAICDYRGSVAAGWTTTSTTKATKIGSDSYPMGFHQIAVNENFTPTNGYTRIEILGDTDSMRINAYTWKATATGTSVYAYSNDELYTDSKKAPDYTNSRYGTAPWGNLTFDSPNEGVLLRFVDESYPANTSNSSATTVDTQDLLRIDLSKAYSMDYMGTEARDACFSARLTSIMCGNIPFPSLEPSDWIYGADKGYHYKTSNIASTNTIWAYKYVSDTTYRFYNMPLQLYKSIDLKDLKGIDPSDTLFNGAKLCNVSKAGVAKTTINFNYNSLSSGWTKVSGKKVRVAFKYGKFSDTPNSTPITGDVKITKVNNVACNKSCLELTDLSSGLTPIELNLENTGDIYMKVQILNTDNTVYTDFTQYAWVDIGNITETVAN